MSAWTVIEHKEISSSVATLTFSSIPQTFTDLILFASFRTTQAGTYAGFRFNGISNGYSGRLLFGSGSGGGNSVLNASDEIQYFETSDSGQTANTFNNGYLYIPNYTASTGKSVSYDVVNENNATSATQRLFAGLWNNTAAITSITIDPLTGDFSAFSSVTLYGITKGSSGGVTVS